MGSGLLLNALHREGHEVPPDWREYFDRWRFSDEPPRENGPPPPAGYFAANGSDNRHDLGLLGIGADAPPQLLRYLGGDPDMSGEPRRRICTASAAHRL